LPLLFGLLALYIGLLTLFNGFANFKSSLLFLILPTSFPVEEGLTERQQKFRVFIHYYPYLLEEIQLFTY